MDSSERRIRVLIVDDSAIVRKFLSETIAAESDMEVVGVAPDPFVARDKILALQPDVLTLDIEMPRMDGLTFLKKLMVYHPMPAVIISSLGHASSEVTLDALRIGAVDVIAKPGGPYSVGELRTCLPQKLRAAAAASMRKREPAAPIPVARPPQEPRTFRPGTVIAIGASTGGTEAIREVLVQLPADTPGIVITQHIPAVFSTAFANRLDKLCALEVKEASDGDEIKPGRVLIAPGNYHMIVRRSGNGMRVQIQDGPRVCYQRPSVDVMFASVAEVVKDRAIGVILTGMGADGARGLLRMKEMGALTLAQDEESCVVYGMPREAVKLNAVDQSLPLSRVAGAILKLASGSTPSSMAKQVKRSSIIGEPTPV